MVASLYTSQCSAPRALLSSAYRGSRSMRGGIWLDLAGLVALDTGNVLLARTGVDTVATGRLSAAGSMSGIDVGCYGDI